MSPGGFSGSAWRRRADRLQAAGSLVRHLGTRLDDVVANQVVIAQHLAMAEVDGYRQPCADAPLSSRVCRQADFGREHAEWLDRLGEPHLLFRKEWEHSAICRALEAGDVLHSGARGLGFGVGKEPLVAAFAGLGVEVTATDLDAGDSRSAAWAATNQHGLSYDGLSRPPVCPDDVLRERVTIRPVDMNAIPADLTGFDFVWSACAFEHLGTIEHGLAFVEEAMRCLRPGGLAVHTTEFNVDSDDQTVSAGDTVAYRRRDIAELERRLAESGHEMSPFEMPARNGILDNLIDVRPYHFGTMLARLGDHRVTSAVLVIRAKS